MKNFIFVFWPSFLVAGIAEGLFFTLIRPQELYLFGEPVYFSETATYSIGFIAFWLICASSSFLTYYLQKSPFLVNNGKVSDRRESSTTV